MSALAGNTAAPATPDQSPRRPGFWRLLRITLVGQFFAAVILWVLRLPAFLLEVAPSDQRHI